MMNGEANGGGPEKTCGQCKHWVAGPKDPMNLRASPQGDCREGPPTTTSLPAPNGGMMHLTVYPKVQDNFSACSRFQAKLTLVDK